MKKTLVLGAGMLAHYLRPFSPTFASRTPRDWAAQDGNNEKGDLRKFHVVDIRDIQRLRSVVEEVKPDVVINAAVFGNIRECEKNPGMANEVNHLGQRNVVTVCNEQGIKVVYISTNSVFCGRTGNYTEMDIPHPGTVYGQSKLRGEEATRNGAMWEGEKEEAGDWAIFRITAIFGEYPGFQDFVQKTIHELRAGNTFSCWDQVISPTYGPFAAKAMMELIERNVKGVWHIAGKEQLRRDEIGEIIRKRIMGGEIRKVGTPGGLPLNRTLSIEKLQHELPDQEIPAFEECVDRMIERGEF